MTHNDAANQPLIYPIHHPRRLSKVIDSLANICVAQASGEVIAVAVRSARNDFEIIVASNGTVPHDTLDYLVTVWDLLCKISMRAGNLRDSPPHKINDTQLLNLVKELEINIIKFTFLKIQKRITSKMDKLLPLPVHDLNQEHPIHQVCELIRYVDEKFLRAEGVLLKKPAFDDSDTWEGLRQALKGISQAILDLLEDLLPGKRPISAGGSLECYLRKIVSIIADTKKLARAAVSPQYKDIFNKTPNIVGLPEEHREINTFPRSADQWELAMERPMSYYNQLPPHISSRRVMDMTVISRDCLEIARRPCPRSSPVHCEVKLLLHLFDEEKQSTNPKPPAYPYIGLSKLSCLGCFNFLLTFNEVLGTRFVTKGTHSKAYFPWGFPESCVEHDQLVDQFYMRLTSHLVPWYNGYVPENVPLAPDATAQSDLTQGDIVNDDFKSTLNEKVEEWKAEKRLIFHAVVI